MTRRSALTAVSVSERTGSAEPEARLFGVGKRSWFRGRTGRTRWPAAARAVVGTRVAWAVRRPEPPKQHGEERDQDDERWVGERQKVKAGVHPLGHQNRVSLPAGSGQMTYLEEIFGLQGAIAVLEQQAAGR